MAIGDILLENLARDAVLTGGDWSGTLDNLVDPRITSLPARCADPSDLGASQFTATWPSPVFMTDIMLCGHTGDLDAMYRITASENGTPLYEGEWTDFFGRVYDTADLPFEQENWYTGKPRLKDIQGYARHLHIRLPELIAADELVVELDVTAQAGIDDYDVGYLVVANPLATGWTYDWGRDLGIRRRTLEEITAGGRKIKTRRRNARVHTVTFPHLTKGEAMRLYDFAMADEDHPAVFLPNTADLVHAFREFFPAHLSVASPPRETNELADDGLSEWSITLTFEEMQG